MRKILLLACAAVLAVAELRPACAQSYAIGADVSFLGKCEQEGVVFKEVGQPKDVLALLHEHQYNWVRLRLFHDPSVGEWHLPNDLAYTLHLAKRARAMGFHVLLDLHYSDTWADPGKQFTPAEWSRLNHKQLANQVFRYTREVIAAFAREGLMPDMVQVGNEITNGMLWPDGKLPGNWDNFADLVRAGIRGVHAGAGSAQRPQIMIHIERSGDYNAAIAFFDNLIARKVRFDVIGMSYYPRWHGDIAAMRVNLSNLALRYHLPIIVAEAAFNWKPVDFIGKKSDFPESPEGQKAFLQAVDAAVRAIPNGLGRGVFWWEPAAEGGLRSRSFFDDDGKVLPVISAFDNPTSR